MMKKILLVIAGCFVAAAAGAVNYYIDPSSGSDRASGTSERKAWKSFANLERVSLQPGDSVLLRAGKKIREPLEIRQSGSAGHPVVFGRYGKGTAPKIICDGSKQHAVLLQDCDYVTVRDLDISNTGSLRQGYRVGVKLYCYDRGYTRGLTLSNLVIHDVNGALTNEQGGGYGILIQNVTKNKPTAFDGILIEDCVIRRCERNGIGFRVDPSRDRWFPNKNVVIRGNLIDQVPGDGIVPKACEGAVVEYNRMQKSPRTLTGTQASAGIWTGDSDGTIIRYNEVSDCKAPWDGQGFDADLNCQGTRIEYNYSHGNEGGFLLVCNQGPDYVDPHGYVKVGNVGSVIEYNISIGDGLRPVPSRQGVYSPIIHIGGSPENTLISHNILHANANPVRGMDNTMVSSDVWSGGYADNTQFVSNLFYAAVPYRFDFTKSTRNLFRDNWFVGKFSGLPKGVSADRDSQFYRHLLAEDPSGVRIAEPLLTERVIAGGAATVHYPDPAKIKKFFEELEGNK